MKDKALRKLLEEKGIIEDGATSGPFKGLRGHPFGFEKSDLDALIVRCDRRLREQDEVINKNANIIDDLNSKFDAINKHYGITVEHEDAKYTVKEIK